MPACSTDRALRQICCGQYERTLTLNFQLSSSIPFLKQNILLIECSGTLHRCVFLFFPDFSLESPVTEATSSLLNPAPIFPAFKHLKLFKDSINLV